MKNKKRRGFTIVELVIVIAVIAILAAVLIPTFSNLIKKANVSADTQLVKNINTALAIDSATNGKHDTAHEAIQTAFDAGYGIAKLTPTTHDYNIMWDSKNDLFVLLDDTGVLVYPKDKPVSPNMDLFMVMSTYENRGYSVYLSGNTDYTSQTALEVSTGFDSGDNIGLDVNYTTPVESSGQSVIIRTNSSILTVNAPNDTVDHYGYIGKVDITKIKNVSYHEHGTAGLVSIAEGRVVFEEKSDVKAVFVKANDAIISTVQNVEMPEISRSDEVTTFTIQTSVNESGTAENVAIVTIDTNTNTITTSASTGTLPQELVTTLTSTESSLATAKTEEAVQQAVKFNGGDGTQNKPYLISNSDQWNNMYDVLSTATSKTYFALVNSIDFTEKEMDNLSINSVDVCLDLNGNGFSVIGINSFSGYRQVIPYIINTNIHDITINYNIVSNISSSIGFSYNALGDTYFSNVVTTGTIQTQSSWISTFVLYPFPDSDGKTDVYYTNCVNRTNLIGAFGTDCYINPFGSHCGAAGVKVHFDKCENYGSISGGDASGFVGMGNADHFVFVDSDAVKNYGAISGGQAAGHFQYGDGASTSTTRSGVTVNVAQTGSSRNMITSFITTVPELGQKIIINEVSGAASYKVQMQLAVQYYDYDDGGNHNKWSGGFPRYLTDNYTSADIQSGLLNTDFYITYAYEPNDTSKLNCRSDAEVAYTNPLVAPVGFVLDENTEILLGDLETSDLLLVSYNGKIFYYMNCDDYEGLVADGKNNIFITYSITAYNSSGAVMAISTVSYNPLITDARAFSEGN